MNTFEYRNGELYCEDVSVAQLAEKYGTPLWIYSQKKFMHELNAIQDAFAECKPVICYSVKANSNLGVLKRMNQAGSSFDVVSGGELYRVEKAGADTTRVVFAGVGKTDEEIRYALSRNILMFNVESEGELDAISAVAASMKLVAPIALRLNPDIDAKTHAKTTTGKKGNKFGMNIERHNELAAKVLNDPNLTLRGIHMHLGSPILTTDPYAAAVKKGAEVIRELRSKGHEIEFMNLGGGFGLSYKGDEAPLAKVYADVIVPTIKELGIRLVLEPGRSIIGNSCILVTKIIYVKREWDKRFLIQDGAMTDLIRPAMYDSFHKIWPVKTNLPVPTVHDQALAGCELADVVGPVCESSDYFAKDRYLPELKRGDLLSIFSAGAYGMAMSSHYNSRPKGAEILVDGSHVEVIRRRETYDDLIAHEVG
jgi:diaminopimelate decarboxylase